MIKIDALEFTPKDNEDPDPRVVLKFNFEIGGILFTHWKIRLKEGHYNIAPPFIKRDGQKTNFIQFIDKEDFLQFSRTVLQAGIREGLLKNPRHVKLNMGGQNVA